MDFTPRPGGPCGLHAVSDPSFVSIKAKAYVDPFRVKLEWSGAPGLYHVNEEGGPFQQDVQLVVHELAASVVHEPALPRFQASVCDQSRAV